MFVGVQEQAAENTEESIHLHSSLGSQLVPVNIVGGGQAIPHPSLNGQAMQTNLKTLAMPGNGQPESGCPVPL